MLMLVWALVVAPPPSVPARLPSGAVLFRPIEEPNERAFAFLVPDGWRVSGGVFRANPAMSGRTLNALGAQLDMTVEDPSGRIRLHWLPETTHLDPRRLPGGQAGNLAQGSEFMGATVSPLVDSLTYLQHSLFPRLSPAVRSPAIKKREPLPELARTYSRVTQAMGIPIQFRYDAGLLIAAYTGDGVPYEEVLFTVIQDWGPLATGLWNDKDTLSVRAPAADLEKHKPVIELILSSIRLNPEWVDHEIRAQIERGDITAEGQPHIQRIGQEIMENRRRSNAEICLRAFPTPSGTEEYVNPLTKKGEVGSCNWGHRWVNERGEVIYTGDSGFDPQQHGLHGFVRSAVRRQPPER